MRYLYTPIFILSIAVSALTGCNSESSVTADKIYSNSDYSVLQDRVIQGDFTAMAVSPTEITTNYKSPADQEFSSIVEFRFSFNSRDNEINAGKSHFAVVTDDTTIYSIGVPQQKPELLAKPLKKDYKWTVRLDMNPMLKSFNKLGYYITATNDTIFKEDFKGVWIAGDAAPLSWDFENLYGKDDRKLKPTDQPGIYALTITLNPTTEAPLDPQTWKISAPNPNYPQYSSNEVLVDALYNMAIDNITSNIRPDNTFRAGAGWDGVWTRDVSYSIYLALSYLDPQRSKNSLMAKVKNERIIQDTGTGGSWPVSSDRIVWSIAAWEIYLTTGDKEWLKYAYNIISKTIEDDKKVVYDKEFKLMHGEQSYLDWREQSYPRWMQPKDIYESMALGTNVIFARAYNILAQMGAELGIQNSYSQDSKQLIDAISTHLWLPDEGYYSEYLYGGVYPLKSPAVDNLGQAISVIWDVAENWQAKSIIENTPVTSFGTTSIFPQLQNIKPYHNNAVWPFVQSFWNLAAAKVKNELAVSHGLGAIYRAAALFGTHKELFVASNGDFRGTAVNSDKMLWSSAGNIAMIFRMYAGMEFTPKGIKFNPFVPKFIKKGKKITGFKYRNSILDIAIEGTGENIKEMKIDGKVVENHFFDATLSGKHLIEIKMDDIHMDENSKIKMSDVGYMPLTPSVTWKNDVSTVQNFDPKADYELYANAKHIATYRTASYLVPLQPSFSLISFIAQRIPYAGYMSQPHEYIPIGSMRIIECEGFAPGGTQLVVQSKSKLYVETTTTKNTDITLNINNDVDAEYFIDIRYANGSGPINTENKCAIRTLIVNNQEVGAIVMPQRGLGEWLNTGFSNRLKTSLKKGNNTIQIKYITPQNINMNGDVNTALIDFIRIIKK